MTKDRTDQPDEVRIDTPNVPIGPPHMVPPFVTLDAVTMDNVNRAEVPSGLVPGAGDAGAKTEWDASSLEKAKKWLEETADFIHSQSYEMVEISDKMGGTAAGAGGGEMGGGTSPLGSFDRAGDLARKHSGLYTSTQQGMRQLAKDLYKAANALQKVKENYETAEGANAMSAAEMQNAFNTASSNRGKA
ncbi:hypothetical protein ACIBXA_15190 [Micromonospora echinaurantiaca]|jgi:hypothetical protein|uniref:hypothetical protein n=1 Tax=Micromonospora TaxID=1873 RepID=UPI000D702FB4|nr:hypothetical protein [Micromonospora sp. S4605]PWU55021.1 hypothetical protein DLJ47_10745 [Micromonospora sp. S4605]